jgi:hypothetical protein
MTSILRGIGEPCNVSEFPLSYFDFKQPQEFIQNRLKRSSLTTLATPGLSKTSTADLIIYSFVSHNVKQFLMIIQLLSVVGAPARSLQRALAPPY